jgi:hypothetical protein
MFIGYELTTSSRNMLLELFPPKYERPICHHITEKYGVPKNTPPPPMPETVKIVGYIDSGDGVEGFLVEINGSVNRPDSAKYHITHSISMDKKPADTNKFVDKAEAIDPIPLQVEPKNFW